MDSQRPKKGKQASGTYNLVAPGRARQKRQFIAARFPQGPPAFAQEAYELKFEGQPPSKQQKGEQKEPSLLLSRKQQQGAGAPKQLQGVPRPDAAGNYFVLSKGGGARDFLLQPLDSTFTFKQLNRSPALSIDEVEAQMRSTAGAGAEPTRLLPKSMRQQMQESAAAAAAEKQLQEDVAPLFDKAKVAELAVKYGAATSGQGKLVLGQSDDEEEGSEDGWGLAGGEEGSARKKGPGKDKKGAAAKGAGKGKRGGKDGGDAEIPEDEVPEDIFAGEEDELRPAAPVEDADWEYNEDAADDDLYQGASDEEEQPDDPGMRKKLGLEEDEEEEEEKKEQPEEDKPEGEAAAAAAAAAGGGAGPSQQASQGGSAESDSVMDDEELIGEDIDLDRLAEKSERDLSQPAKRRKGSVGPQGRDRSPAPSRLATPPLGSTAVSAGGSRATPPLGGNRRGSTPPLGSKAAAAAGGSKKTPPPGARRTPPPGGAAAAKRKREEAAAGAAAAAAGAAAAAAGAPHGAAGPAAAAPGGSASGYRWRADQLDPQGVPTVEAVMQALQELGPIPTSQITLLNEHLDAVRVGEEGKKLLKSRILQVAKVEARGGVKYVILKSA